MPKQDQSRDVDKMVGQKNNNYETIGNDSTVKKSGEKIPKCACDRKRCLKGRCGICWMVIVGLSIAVGIFFILWISDVLGFDFETSGDDTLYELICSNCTDEPTSNPTMVPSVEPTSNPTDEPTGEPTYEPSAAPSTEPTLAPSADPTVTPSEAPTVEPTFNPTADPTVSPTEIPTDTPTTDPTSDPTTGEPTAEPTNAPSENPTIDPTLNPTGVPSLDPTNAPTTEPTKDPTGQPSSEPTKIPTDAPTNDPTLEPTVPTSEPTTAPTDDPTSSPTDAPTTEPTEAPTDEPTADPTSERRRSDLEDRVANVLFVTVDGTTFDYTEFETPEVDQFFMEGYTFNNLKNQFSLSTLLTGKNVFSQPMQDGAMTWAEQIRAKGYKNYYYGSWMINSGNKVSTPVNRGWDFFFGTAYHPNGTDFKYITDDDQIMEKVQSHLLTIKDDKWSLTVNWTAPFEHNEVRMTNTNTPVFWPCSRYFQVGGTDFDYQRGVICQWTMEYDSMFGKVLKSLKSAGLWSRTIVIFVIGGRKDSIFSFNGGALPKILRNRTNEDRHSMLDVVPTILAVSGFSDREVVSAKLDGFPISGMSVNNIEVKDL